MNNLDFFKTQLEQIVALNEPDQIEAAVANFLAQRMPREQLVRQGLGGNRSGRTTSLNRQRVVERQPHCDAHENDSRDQGL
jgi:hypothetical protein